MRLHLCKSKGPRPARTPAITHWWQCSQGLFKANKGTCTRKEGVKRSLRIRMRKILQWAQSRATRFWNFPPISPHRHFLANANTEATLPHLKKQIWQIKFWSKVFKLPKTTRWALRVNLQTHKLVSITGLKPWILNSFAKIRVSKDDHRQVLNAARLAGAIWLQQTSASSLGVKLRIKRYLLKASTH